MIHKQKFEIEQYDLQNIFTFKEITDQEYNSCSSYKDEGPLLESCGNKKKHILLDYNVDKFFRSPVIHVCHRLKSFFSLNHKLSGHLLLVSRTSDVTHLLTRKLRQQHRIDFYEAKTNYNRFSSSKCEKYCYM